MNEELTLTIERDFDAPIQKVWQAWTDPEMLQKWSCPDTFEVTKIGGVLKVGGEWHMTMESSTPGYNGSIKGKYLELIEPTKIVSTHTWINDDGSEDTTTYTVELSERDGKTHMVYTQTGFANKGIMEGHNGGWSQCFAKLEAMLSV